VKRFRSSGLPAVHASGIEVHNGLGISGFVGVGRLFVGSRRLFKGADVPTDESSETRTVVYYGWDRVIAGRLVFGDSIRNESRALVASLHGAGIRTIVVSGDSARATEWVSREVGAGEFRAEILPGGKSEIIEALQHEGLTVAMIGDGVNDAPALARANLGIAMGGGTDLAMKAASIVLMKNDLDRVTAMLDLSRLTLRVIRQNLFWSFGYNTIGLVMAAFGLLNPIVASSAMVVSSICVTANALRLSRSD